MTVKPWFKNYQELGISAPTVDDRPLGAYAEQHAVEFANDPALQYFSRSINYAQFNEHTNQLANALAELGVGRGDVVGLNMPNLPQYVFALAAISKLGAIGSGVSPLLAPPELAYQVDNAGIQVLISLADLAPNVSAVSQFSDSLKHIVFTGARDLLDAPALSVPTASDINGQLEVHEYLALTARQSSDFSQVETHWNDTFMIQYTGGTTGQPKGAELSIRTVMMNPKLVNSCELEVEPGTEVFASAFPMFHIAGLSFAVSAVMTASHQLIIPNPRDMDNFVGLLKAFPPNRLAAVPALYDMLLAHPEFKEVDFSGLDNAKTGAAPMSRTTYDQLSAVIGENRVSDVFGMTETGPCYTAHPVNKYRSGSVGFPVPSTDVKIMDVTTGEQEMPFGEVGEICTSGPHLMKGYLNLPEESAHALREIDGERWMYSGDVGYMDEDGYIYVCDRAKDMLIVGGYKVFSVEVEDKLKALPQIAESALIGEPDTQRLGNDVVHLYVQLSEDHKQREHDEIRAEIVTFMRDNLAAYKVAKQIHFIDAIPLTAVGKIDKKALRT